MHVPGGVNVGAKRYRSSVCILLKASSVKIWVDLVTHIYASQVFGLIPCLLIDERRKDAGRLDLACYPMVSFELILPGNVW